MPIMDLFLVPRPLPEARVSCEIALLNNALSLSPEGTKMAERMISSSLSLPLPPGAIALELDPTSATGW